MNRILEVDTRNRRAVVEPGVVNADLSAHTRRFGFHYAPDPSSQQACTLGGNNRHQRRRPAHPALRA